MNDARLTSMITLYMGLPPEPALADIDAQLALGGSLFALTNASDFGLTPAGYSAEQSCNP